VRWKARLPLLAAALWWGSLSAIGFLVVPLLFANAPSPALAGRLAAHLFSGETWVSVACGMLLLVLARSGEDEPSLDWAQGALVYVLLGMLLALLAEFAIAPRIVSRENLKLWHSLGTLAYAAQWLCALVVLWKLAGSPASPPSRG
jgi:hypothetical protein